MKVLVSEQDGRESVSTMMLGDDEAASDLVAEATMHVLGGWNVTAFVRKGGCPIHDLDQIVCVHPSGIVRRFWHRSVDPAMDGQEGTS